MSDIEKIVFVESDAVADWWRIAIESYNQQVETLAKNGEVDEFIDHMKNELNQMADDENMPDEVRQELINNANVLMDDEPGTMILGHWMSSIVPVFMKHMADNSFNRVLGTSLSVFAVRSDDNGRIRGADIKRHENSEEEISEIAANGMAGIEDLLKSISPSSE